MSGESGPPDAAGAVPSVTQLARAMRFAIVCVALVATWENIAVCNKVEAAGRIFEDMLGVGSALPPITVWVMKSGSALNVISYALPVAALSLLFLRNVLGSIYAAGALLLFTMGMTAVVNHGLWQPLFDIVRRMQGPGVN